MDKLDKIIKDFFLAKGRAPKLGSLLNRMNDAEKVIVPEHLLAKVRAQIPKKDAVHCPYCHKAITPFRKPLSRQKILNLTWLAAAAAFFSLSFAVRQYFIQWVALGALCAIKWIVDQKATKTQIMIYKALSEEPGAASRFNFEETQKQKNRDAGDLPRHSTGHPVE